MEPQIKATTDSIETIAARMLTLLRDAIVRLELKPGDSISEAEIADRYGVSRQPVREAFIRLAQQGLLLIRPKRATLVKRIAEEGIRQSRFIRIAIEVEIARKVAEAKPYSAPEGEIEQKLAALWSELLQIPEIGRDDDFFSLGGHSLLALRLFSRINREFGRTLPLAALLGHPTIAKLAALLCPQAEAGLPTGAGKGHLVTLAESGDGTPLFCLHGGDGGVLFYRSLAELMPPQGQQGGPAFHKIGGAALAAELDAKRAIREGAELAARL